MFLLNKIMNPVRNFSFVFLYGAAICLFQSCQNTPANIPFPENETEFAQPVSVPYKFSESKKVKWEVSRFDSIKPVTIRKIDFKTLPSEPFELGDFHPLVKPIEVIKLNWNHLPDTVFDLDKIPSQKFSFVVSPLGQPIRTKAFRPRVRDKATQSIFEYGLDQGLSTGGGMGPIFQDSRSFLWIGTANGLYRFDGENFDLYTAASGLKNFISIGSLSEDSLGQIWTGNAEGFDVINLEQGIIKHVGIAQMLTGKDISSVMTDSLGNVWACIDSGLVIINPKNETLKQITMVGGPGKNNTLGLLKDDFGNIWVGTTKGVSIINLKNKTLKRLTGSEGLSGDHFAWELKKDEKGRILIGTLGGGLNIIDIKNGTLKHIGKAQGLESDNIRSLISDGLCNVWISTGKSLDVVNVDSGKIRHLTTAEGLTSNYIDRLLKDDQGHIWMSCGYAEVDAVDLNGRLFRRQDSKLAMTKGAVRTLYEDKKGIVWIANSTYRFYIADAEAGTIKYIDGSKEPKIIPSGFAESGKDQIWIDAYGDTGLYNYNLSTGILKHFKSEYFPLADQFSGILNDKQGRIWIWGEGGITVLDPPNNLIKFLSPTGGLSNKRVYFCRQDDQGKIWIATDDGIDILDANLETIRYLTTENGQRIKNALSFASGGKGKILMDTYGYGLYIIDQETGRFTQFTTGEGLVSDQVTSLIEKNGSIYAGTSQGLTILDPEFQSNKTPRWLVRSFEKEQLFFDHVDFNPTALLTKKGQLWWGVGGQGVIIMDESEKDTVIPVPYITSLDIMEQPQIWSNPDTNHVKWDSVRGPWRLPVNLSLPYDQNYVRLHFTGTHLGNIDKTRYRYILEGKDSSWSKITDQSFASFISLKPGKYIFKVAARGYNGLWSHPAEMGFTIRPPWWETWWAYLLFFITAIIILWGGMTVYHSGQIRAENLRLEVKVVERTKELKHSLEDLRSTQNQLIQSEKMASLGELTAGIAHEIQNPLNFVNNFSDINKELLEEMKAEIKNGNLDELNSLASNVIENEEKINHHGKRADAIVKGMLQHSRTTSGVKEVTDINALADEYLRLAYHGLRAKDKSFNASMKKDYDKTIGLVQVIPQDLGRVFLNLYNNAFYAVDEKKKKLNGHYEPTVSVSTKKTDGKIFISVKDNGNGIPPKVMDKIFQPFFTTKPTGQGTGLGLSISYDIIRAHGGELKVNTTEGEGSEFVVQLPIV
jgi:signal transduction histidine kinase/ligand-binding sensor domain-containing protein